MSCFFDEFKSVFSGRPKEGIVSFKLPFVHSTSAYNALEIVKQKELHAVEDNKIKEHEQHLYFYYGRAAYPVNKGELPRGDDSYFPCCFLFNGMEYPIEYAFPFDSGAFLRKMYSPFINESSTLQQFFLPSSLDSIDEYIYYAFGSAYNYTRGIVESERVTININTSYQVRGFYNMLINKSAQQTDSRCRTIEVVGTDNMKLTSETLLAVVIPEILRDHRFFKELIAANPKAELLSYPCFFGDTDDSYQGVVREKVFRYLETHQYFSNYVLEWGIK